MMVIADFVPVQAAEIALRLIGATPSSMKQMLVVDPARVPAEGALMACVKGNSSN